MVNRKKIIKGFGMIEVILAVALWGLIAAGGVFMSLGSLRLNRQGAETTEASLLAAEGVDAVRAIKKQGWSSPFLSTDCTAGCGLASASGTWTLSGTSDVTSKYTRQIFINQSQRDGSGNIVDSGGVADTDTYKVTSQVSWNRGVPPITNTVSVVSYLTNFTKAIGRGGLLVYGDGGTTTDAMSYKVFDGSTWGSALAMADVDGTTTNRALRVIRIYSSQTRSEKIVISRHFDGTNQYIYAQVWNGSSWGNVKLLSSWAATSFLNVQNFDGSYLSNGSFMAVYSDNTSTPKMSIWDGSVWGTQSALTSLGGGTHIPTYIRAAARPGTNEVMGAFLDQAKATITQYYNGSVWSGITSQSTNDFNNPYRDMDFTWSPVTPTVGAITYLLGGGDKKQTVKLFQADGLGSGTWGAQSQSVGQASPISDLMITAGKSANEFQICNTDNKAPDNITCHRLTFSGTTATWGDATNNIITTGTVSNATQLPFDMDYETSGAQAVIAFSDNTTVAKYKAYNESTNTFDTTASNIGTLTSTMNSARVIPVNNSDDMMILLGDASAPPKMYSVVWDGTNGVMYTTPSSKAFQNQAANGSAATDYWYDFSWDEF